MSGCEGQRWLSLLRVAVRLVVGAGLELWFSWCGGSGGGGAARSFAAGVTALRGLGGGAVGVFAVDDVMTRR